MDFNYLRRRSLFDNSDGDAIGNYSRFEMPDYESPSLEQPRDDESRFSRLYDAINRQQSGPAQSAYKQYLESMPDREQFKPGKGRKIAALLGGLGEAFLSHSPSRSIATARDIMDRPYNTAVENFRMKEGRYKTAAELEEKDNSNKIKTIRDIMEDEARTAREKREQEVATARIEDFKSRARQREQPKFNFFNDSTTGTHKAAAYNPQTKQFETQEIGKVGPTADEQIEIEGKKAGARFRATKKDRMDIAAAGAANRERLQDKRFNNIKDLLEWKQNNIKDYKAEVDTNSGTVKFVNKKDPTDVVDSGIEHGKLSDKEKADLGLKNAKELEADRQKNRKELKQTPGPDVRTTTETEVDGNKKKTVSSKESTAPKTDDKVLMIDPSGKPYRVDPKEVEEAIKHGWKRK